MGNIAAKKHRRLGAFESLAGEFRPGFYSAAIRLLVYKDNGKKTKKFSSTSRAPAEIKKDSSGAEGNAGYFVGGRFLSPQNIPDSGKFG